jgi:2-polyprenyl-3-methyl-5-hydroxy-6-metoxy-1,4-benzoquinol methylase
MTNLNFQDSRLDRFYATQRQTWAGLYPSERWILDALASRGQAPVDILDVGCASGGIGRGLAERFPVVSYVGVDINRGLIDAAQRSEFPVPAEFYCLDIIEWTQPRQYQTVLALSCADFNIETDSILAAAWRAVQPGGTFIVSLRLTPKSGVNDMTQSYQLLDTDAPDGHVTARANYAVMNVLEALDSFRRLPTPPDHILAYGYWGAPALTARTPFERVVFTVFAVQKPVDGSAQNPRTELHLPLDLWPPQPHQ